MKPYYEDDYCTVYHGDCREILAELPKVDLVLTDPPYGDTSLEWDSRVSGWQDILPGRQLWCCGSFRFFLATDFGDWRYAQEIVWEKHNGSGFHADRFRRVHEFVVHFYKGDWASLYKDPQTTPDAVKRRIHAKYRPAHMGDIDRGPYESIEGGPRLMRSVQKHRSEHGRALHPTQKPISLLLPIIKYSCSQEGVILDPFMGSGTTLRAAKDLRRKAIGIEIDEKYCEIAGKRLQQEVLPL